MPRGLVGAATCTLLHLLLGACQARVPTAPAMHHGNTILFADGGRLAPHEGRIRGAIERSLAAAGTVLPVTGVTVTVTADSARTIPGWGLGGYAPDGARIEVVIDPTFPDLARHLGERLPPVVVHEIHHVIRWRGPGYGTTLLEALVSEGLADRFAVELLAGPTPPWSDAFPAAETTRYMELARPEFDSTAYDFARWFFGAHPTLPRWAGYTLGYRLVESYQARKPGLTAARLVHTPAGELRPD